MDIGVIGCGFAGSAAALFLARAGHKVTAYEAVDDPQPVGAGIMLQPSGMDVLDALGLLEPVLERGDRVSSLFVERSNGKKLLDLHYAMLDERLFGLGLHRGVLFQTLFEAAQRETVDVRTGIRITQRVYEHDRVTLIDEQGVRHGAHEVVIVADGARSQVRERNAGYAMVSRYPWGAMWVIAEDPDGVFDGVLYQRVEGAHKMIGLLPTGRAPRHIDSDTADNNLVSLFVSIRADREGELRAGGLKRFQEQVVSLMPRAEPVVAQIESLDQVLFAPYYDVVMSRWHDDDRVVFIGDAAHATSPQLGQGSNLALCDAMALARAFGECERPGHEAQPREAFRRYQRARRAHLAYYQRATRWLTPFFQHDSRALGTLRDVGMPIAATLPFVKREMVRSMCGTKTFFALPGVI